MKVRGRTRRGMIMVMMMRIVTYDEEGEEKDDGAD